MAKYFNEVKWSRILKNTTWYSSLYDELNSLDKLAKNSTTERAEEIKEEVRGFFEKKIAAHEIVIGNKQGLNLDKERKSINTIVIHHTSHKPGYSWQRLNAIHLLNIYVPKFTKDPDYKGQPIYSNHFRDGQPVFYSYHWLIRMDGGTERLLNDSEIGWHAGNWDINCQSIGICLDNDYENSSPTKEVIRAVSALIRKGYPTVSRKRVFGHREISQAATCPGNKFLVGWKEEILAQLSNS